MSKLKSNNSPNLEKYYEILELLFKSLPYVFWKDKEGKYQGSNLNQAINMGFSSPEDFIGKSIFEILNDQESAKLIHETDNRIMNENTPLISEERIVTPIGERIYLSQKSPVRDNDGKVIGLLGFAMDITDIKKQKERDRLVNIAAQVAHDIRSPAASLLMLAKSCQNIPEKERIALREAATSIQDIANNLLNQYKKKENHEMVVEERESILVFPFLLQTLAEKKLQYQNLPIKFDTEFSQTGSFAFIKIEPSAFKRALSNIINNAVDALDRKKGKISLILEADNESVKITIEDNGAGIPPELIEKLLKNEPFTQGKKEGHGMGFLQVWETLEKNQGELSILSEMQKGTKITLKFPRLSTPRWIAEAVHINSDDFIIILDDDISIHGAWDARFESILKKIPTFKIKHFTHGLETMEFINSLNPADKEKVFLLTDYELLRQPINGLQVIVQSKSLRSILVTSHYANPAVREEAAKTATKILPKQLASEVPILINKRQLPSPQKADLVLVDDDETYVEALVSFVLSNKVIDKYHDPHSFLKNAAKYSKDSKIFLDNNFKNAGINGLAIAQKLHQQGYKNLYILSGEDFQPEELPSFITLIRKDDIEHIQNIISDNKNNQDKQNEQQFYGEQNRLDLLAKTWTRMIGCISHDLTNPLATLRLIKYNFEGALSDLVKGYKLAINHQLLDQTPMEQKRVQAIEKNMISSIQQNIDRMQEFLNSLRPYNLQLLSTSPETISFSAQSVVRDALKRVSFLNDEERNLIHLDFPMDFNFKIAPIFIEKLLDNLLNNALNAIRSAEKGEINIWPEESQFHYQLHFKDSASGMTADSVKNIFQRFFSDRNGKKIPGLGFCRLALIQKGGDIVCNSIEGKFTHFIINFPKED